MSRPHSGSTSLILTQDCVKEKKKINNTKKSCPEICLNVSLSLADKKYYLFWGRWFFPIPISLLGPDRAQMHDFWPRLWLFSSTFILPPKKRGKKKRRMNSKNRDVFLLDPRPNIYNFDLLSPTDLIPF